MTARIKRPDRSIRLTRSQAVHLFARRPDGIISADCIRTLKGDPRESMNCGEMRITTDLARVTCALCRTAEVS